MSTATRLVTVGWTQPDRATGYSNYDGYRPGASQHTETFAVEVPRDFDDERLCWLLLEATNSPTVRPADATPAGDALGAIVATGYTGAQAHWSLSRGDTVTIHHTEAGPHGPSTTYAFTGYAVVALDGPERRKGSS